MFIDGLHDPSQADLDLTGDRQAVLHERAVEARDRHYGRRVFVRGVVEVSNYCRENCSYCGMRRDNGGLARFRISHDVLAETLLEQRPDCVTDINIQAGEDPVVVREVVIPLIRTLRRETTLGISVCLGTLSHSLYEELKNAGAGFYIMKFEMSDPDLYARLEAPGTLGERLDHIRWLASHGWMVSSGFIAGLPGQQSFDLVDNLKLAGSLPLQGCSVSPFIPGADTPCSAAPSSPVAWTLNAMAVLRLMRPNWIIPAVSALNLMDSEGYQSGLRAGANLVTMNLTPDRFRPDYVIYQRDRFIMTEEKILNALESAGLEASTVGLMAHCRATLGHEEAKPHPSPSPKQD